jgi:hypothetical protein
MSMAAACQREVLTWRVQSFDVLRIDRRAVTSKVVQSEAHVAGVPQHVARLRSSTTVLTVADARRSGLT